MCDPEIRTKSVKKISATLWFQWINGKNCCRKTGNWIYKVNPVHPENEAFVPHLWIGRMKKRRKRSQTECHMTYGIPCPPQAEHPKSGLCFRMCKKVFLNRFGMKVKPAAQTLERTKRKTTSQHLQFDSLQPAISSETLTITLNQTITNGEPTKIDSFKLMRTPPHEMLMWQVVTDAFGSLLRYAQDSVNVFFCPT